ncbi:MAG: WbqC family protein, partial [Bacteroidales bacterium]|nr:WbqC family protein [Bacteroidales bacterium]
MLACLLTTAYLAPVHYYCHLFHYKKIIIERHCHYQKQTYRNRCAIASANGVLFLSVPVEKTEKQLTKDARIAEHGNWQHLHWNA